MKKIILITLLFSLITHPMDRAAKNTLLCAYGLAMLGFGVSYLYCKPTTETDQCIVRGATSSFVIASLLAIKIRQHFQRNQ